MLVQRKEKRAVAATHEPLVDVATFDAIQKSFQAKAFYLATNNQSTDNPKRESYLRLLWRQNAA